MINKIRLVLISGSILSALYFFANGYLFYLFFIITDNGVQYHSNVVVSFNLYHSERRENERYTDYCIHLISVVCLYYKKA